GRSLARPPNSTTEASGSILGTSWWTTSVEPTSFRVTRRGALSRWKLRTRFLVAVDGGQHQVSAPAAPGQPVGQLPGPGQVEAEPGGLAADLGSHGLRPALVRAGRAPIAGLAG